MAADCPNRRLITLAEWDAVKEDIVEEETEEEVQEQVEIPADEGDMLELNPLLSVQQCPFEPRNETPTSSPPTDSTKYTSYGHNMVELRTHLNNRHLLNLRTNSFQQGENDGDPPWGHP